MFKRFPLLGSDSIELERQQQGQAVVNLWSSLSVSTHSDIEAELSEMGLGEPIDTLMRGDVPAGRSVHRAADRAQSVSQNELTPLGEMLKGAAEIHTVVASDGTGQTGMEARQPLYGEPLDQITKYHVISPNPTDRERICRAFNFAAMGRNNTQNVLISKDSHDESPRYPDEMADICVTCLFIDSMNLFDSAVIHDKVPASDVPNTRDELRARLFQNRAELGHAPSGALGFSAEVFLPPNQSISMDAVWGNNPYRAYVVYPTEYDGTGLTDDLVGDGDSLRVTSQSAPVEEIRILMTRELDDDFISKVKTSNIQWLYEQADSLNAWQKEIKAECSPRTDPKEEVTRFLTANLNVYDEEVLSTLREVGADV